MPTGLGDEQLWISATNDNTGTSTAFSDQSGQGNDGTATGATVVADTSEGGSYAFNLGGTDSVLTTNAIQFGSNGFSMSFWMYSNNNWNGNLLDNYEGGAGKEYAQVKVSGGRDISIQLDDGASNVQSSATEYNNTTWYLHTFVVSRELDGSGDIAYYRDGTHKLSTSIPTGYGSIDSNVAFFLGYGLSGKMDDIRVFTRALTQAEITHLASTRGAEGTPPVGLGDEKLWLCPSLNDSANDISGNGDDGTYQGSIATVPNTDFGGSLAYESAGASSAYITTGDQFDKSPSWTMAWWHKRTDAFNSSLNRYFLDCRTGNNGFTIFYRNAGLSLGIYRNATYYGTANGAINDGLTSAEQGDNHHYTMCYDDSTATITMFVDGVLTDTIVTTLPTGNTIPATTTTATLFNYKAAPATQYNVGGEVDDLRKYERVLAQDEITHLAEARGIEGTPPVGLGGEQLWFCPSLRADGNDITASATNEALVGSMAIVSDTQSGGSLAYDTPDGTTGGLTFTPPASTIASGQAANVTVAMWADHTSFSTNYLFSIGENSFSNHMVIQGLSNDFIRGSVNGGITGGSEQFSRNNPMQHYVFEFTATTIKTWVNGTLASTVAGTWAGDTWDRGAIGALARASTTQGSQCTLDDIRVYGRNLTQAEITHLATSRGIEGSPSTPTAQYNAFTTHAFKQLFQQRLR